MLFVSGLVLLMVVLVLSTFLLCHFKPELVGIVMSHQLKQVTGCVWELNDLKPSLFPPGVEFYNIAVYEESDSAELAETDSDPIFSAKRLLLEPSLLKLMAGGRIEFRSLVLDTPVFRLNPTLFIFEDKDEFIEAEIQGLGKEREEGEGIGGGVVPLPSPNPTLSQSSEQQNLSQPLQPEQSLQPEQPEQSQQPEQPEQPQQSGGPHETNEPASHNVAVSQDQLTGDTPSSFEEDLLHQVLHLEQPDVPLGVSAEVLQNATSHSPFGPPVPREIRRMQYASNQQPRLSSREQLGRDLENDLRYFRRKLNRDWGKRLWSLRIINGDFTQHDKDGNVLLGVHNINVDASLSPWHTSVVKGVLALPQEGLVLDSEVTFTLPSKFTKTFIEATVDVQASLSLPNERPITGQVSTGVRWTRSNLFVVDRLNVQAEGDTLDAIAEFDPSTLTAVGQLTIGQLSLPRWFFFARNLPPGLQEALHAITGTVNFSTDLQGIWGTELAGKAGSLDVAGTIGVDAFMEPVVKVDITSDYADADALFPFLATSSHTGAEPIEPEFTMPYLAPFPGPGGEDAPDVWYDVRVYAREGRVHDLGAKDLLVTVVPVGETLTRVDIFCPQVGGGRLKGRLDIDKTLTLMDFDVKGLDLALLPENINSGVVFGGRVTGKTRLTIDVKNTAWADIWGIDLSGTIADQSITLTGKDGWTLSAKDVDFSGKGKVNTIRAEGLTLTGLWKVVTKGVHSSWYRQGNDAVNYTLNGAFAWPDAVASKRYSGIQRISGDIVADGAVHLPLGDQIVPVRGVLRSPLNWDIEKDILRLSQYEFKGMDSISNGSMELKAGGQETVFTAAQRFSLSPRTVLSLWKLLPEAIQMPKLMVGSSDLKATAEGVLFSKLRFDADGAIATGKVNIKQPQGARKNVLWDVDLQVKRLDLDNYLVPPTPEEKRNPSTEPWQLQFLDGMDIHSVLKADHVRYRDTNLKQFQSEVTLKDKALSAMILSSDVYGGRVTGQVTGRIEPSRSMVTLSKGNLVMKSINLAAAFADQGKGGDYGGKADIVFDVSGTMRSDADMPAALSGVWGLEIRDGLYPAFVGSKTAGLRNTFSKASADGKMTKGVLETSNFLLSSSMVAMKGGGRLDLGKRVVDMNANVTLAGMPTFPVVVQGEFETFTINVGGNFITGTAHVAGSTIFNIFKGILELPGKAVSGVNSLLKPKGKVERTEYEPYRR